MSLFPTKQTAIKTLFYAFFLIMPDAFRMRYFEIQNPSAEITQGEVRKGNNLKINNLHTLYIQMCNIKTSFYGIITVKKTAKDGLLECQRQSTTT